MASGRFNPLVVPVDHWRRLVNYDSGKPAILTRTTLIVVPLGLAALSYWRKWNVSMTGDVVGSLGLVAGVFLSAFGIILTLRMARQSGSRGLVSRNMNASLDESAMALLSAALFAGVAAVFFTVVSATGATHMNRYTSMVAIWISSYVVLYFILAIGRLYVAYVNAFPAPWSVKQATRGAVAPSPEEDIATGERPVGPARVRVESTARRT